jgi:hypothetical protein
MLGGIQGRENPSLFCSSCMAALKPGARFCPQCGHAVDSAPRRRPRGRFLAVFAAMFVAVLASLKVGSMNHRTAVLRSSADVSELDAHLHRQINSCSMRIDQLKWRSNVIRRNRDHLASTLPDIQNFDERLKAAIQRGDDENRWPIRIAGRSFERDQAMLASARLDDYLGRTQRSLDDSDRNMSDCVAEISKTTETRDELQTLVRRVEQNQNPHEIAEIQAFSSRIEAEENHKTRIDTNPAGFTTADLDTLLK